MNFDTKYVKNYKHGFYLYEKFENAKTEKLMHTGKDYKRRREEKKRKEKRNEHRTNECKT